MKGKPVSSISENERVRKGFVPWDSTKEFKKATSVSAWTQFYHKPYQTDWQQAHNKAVERKLYYINQ